MTYREIKNIAESKNLEKETIDKDWVLGHILNAFYSFGNNGNNFVFNKIIKRAESNNGIRFYVSENLSTIRTIGRIGSITGK